MKTSTLWIWRIAFILLCGMFPAMSLLLGIEILPLLTGIGFMMLIVVTGLLSRGLHGSNKTQIKFDNIVFKVALIGMIVCIAGTFIKINGNDYIYRNGDGYEISAGGHPGDTVPSSFMVWIPENSKVVEHNNIMLHKNGGSWFFYVGKPADINKFYIKVEEDHYLIGNRTYISFYYNDVRLDSQKAKFVSN